MTNVEEANAANSQPPKRLSRIKIAAWIVICSVILACSGLIAASLPGILEPSSAHRRTISVQNLKQIGLALHSYHQEYRCFPPAYIADENGRPMHSWRVLILPYMDQQAIYNRYRFDEPWDGPHNRNLHPLRPHMYADPSSHDETQSFTNYAVITGEGTMFPGAKPVAIRNVRDGVSTVLAVVSIGDSDIVWCEPRDLEFDAMSFRINDPDLPGIACERFDTVPVLFGDASVQALEEGISSDQLRSMILRSDQSKSQKKGN